MYDSAEAVIRLSTWECQQALGIWLDSDAEQAIRFIKEKIVNKALPAHCKRSAASMSIRRIAPCHLRKCSSICCRAGEFSRRV